MYVFVGFPCIVPLQRIIGDAVEVCLCAQGSLDRADTFDSMDSLVLKLVDFSFPSLQRKVWAIIRGIKTLHTLIIKC